MAWLLFFWVFVVPAHSGDLLVIDGLLAGGVKKFDAGTGNSLGSMGDVGFSVNIASGIAFHPDTGNLMVSELAVDSGVIEFDGNTGKVVGKFGETHAQQSFPGYLAFHPATKNLLVADFVKSNIQEYDGTTGALIGVWGATDTNTTAPLTMVFHPTTGNLFVADHTNLDIRQFDGTSGAFLGTFIDSANVTTPFGMAFHPTTENLFVADAHTGEIKEFNGTSGAFIAIFGQTAANLTQPFGITFHPETGNLLVSDSGTGDVREFDGTTGNFIGIFGQSATELTQPRNLIFQPEPALKVTPEDDLTASGAITGPFSPESQTYTLTNTTGQNLSYSVDKTQSWITLSNPSNGTLAPGASQNVTVSLGKDAGRLIVGDYQDTISFNNGSGGTGSTKRTVMLNVQTNSSLNFDPDTSVISPYWETGGSAYTFMSVAFPLGSASLSLSHPGIGVSVNVILSQDNSVFGTTEFTVKPDEIQRIFVVPPLHPLVTLSQVDDAKVIIGISGGFHGRVLFNPIATDPKKEVDGFNQDITTLLYWGAIVGSSFHGFAMEFIGDAHDSIAFNTPFYSGIN